MEPSRVEGRLIKQEPDFCEEPWQAGETLPTICVNKAEDTGDTVDSLLCGQQSGGLDLHDDRNTEYSPMEYREMSRRERVEENEETNVPKEEEGTPILRRETEGISEGKQVLNKHLRLNQKIKKCYINCQHKCPSCGAEFLHISNLIKHLKIHRRQNVGKSKRLLRDAEDLQVASKKLKGNSKDKCSDFRAEDGVRVKLEINMQNEEVGSEPEINLETRIKSQDSDNPEEGCEGHANSLLPSHQSCYAKTLNNDSREKCKIEGNQQRCVDVYLRENKCTGTVLDEVVNTLHQPKNYTSTDTAEMPSSITGCSTEFSMTSYIHKLFKCDICGEVFSLPEQLSSHYITSHATLDTTSGNVSKCSICGHQFPQQDLLQTHLATHTQKEILLTCKNYKAVTVIHKTDAKEKPDSDSSCRPQSGMANHKQKHSNETTNVNSQCVICGEVWNSRSEYLSHIVARHATKDKGQSDIFWKCNICGRKCSRRDVFQKHFTTHIDRERPFKCKTCTMDFFHARELESHEKIHSGVYKYNCDICKKGFHEKRGFQRHMKKHSIEKPYTCTNSRRKSENIEQLESPSFQQNDGLNDKCINESSDINEETSVCENNYNNIDDQQIESTAGNFKKPSTGSVTADIDQLDNSLIIKTDTTNSVNISSSDAEFRLKSYVGKSCNDNTSVTTCKCDICGEMMLLPEQLRSHIMTHHATMEEEKTGNIRECSCNVCGKTFSRKDALVRHLAIHTHRERPFKCKTCGLGCFTKGELTRHEHIHTAVHKYNCDICKKGFHKKMSLQSHLRVHYAYKSPACTSSKKSSESLGQVGTSSKNTGKSDLSTNANEDTIGREKILNHVKHLEKHLEIGSPTGQDKPTDKISCAEVKEIDQTDTPVIHNKTDSVEKTDSVSSDEFDKADHKQTSFNETTNVNFECGICGEVWNSRTEYLSHIVAKHATKDKGQSDIFCKCNICGQQCSRKGAFERHLLTHTDRERSFQCKTCAMGFFEQWLLFRHEKIHSGVYEYNCDICKKGFRGKRCFRRHMEKHSIANDECTEESSAKTYTCYYCGKTFLCNRHLLAHHRNIHQTKCDVCDTMVPDRDLKRHMRRHDVTQIHKCDMCEKQFSDIRTLKRHRSVHSGEYPFVCDFCGEGFAYSGTHQIHVAAHTWDWRFVCDICGSKFNLGTDLASHEKQVHRNGEKRRYSCDGCHRSYRSESALKRHMKTHIESANYRCGTCDRSFHVESSLKQHRLTHKEKTIKCEACGKGFPSSVNLETHMKRAHGPKRWICDTCGKGFRENCQLQIHIVRCHGEKAPYRYMCEFCGKMFSTRDKLYRHLDVHKDAKYGHTCKTCNAQFLHLNKLKIHERIHTGERPFACDICGKGFRSNSERLSHRKLHTLEKSHKCGECGRMFAHASTLKEHSRMHSGEKPHQCDLCGDRFRHGGTLHNHIRLVHKKKGVNS